MVLCVSPTRVLCICLIFEQCYYIVIQPWGSSEMGQAFVIPLHQRLQKLRKQRQRCTFLRSRSTVNDPRETCPLGNDSNQFLPCRCETLFHFPFFYCTTLLMIGSICETIFSKVHLDNGPFKKVHSLIDDYKYVLQSVHLQWVAQTFFFREMNRF